MSKLTALITTLVLGSSASIALASPARTSDHRPGAVVAARIERPVVAARFERPVVTARIEHGPAAWRPAPVVGWRVARDRFETPVFDRGWRAGIAVDDFGPRRYRPTWVALGAPRPLVRGQECIEVRDGGTFTQLRLQSESGFAEVDRVIVQFADGTSQVADLDRRLDGFVELPLDGNNRRIDRIIVTGAARDLQVFAI
jgi:hypothetical protein